MARPRPSVLILALLGGHCGSSPPPKAPPAAEQCKRETAVVTLAASEQVNASAGGAGIPVGVRIYQLESDARLTNAAFEEVWQNDKAVLQSDLLKMEEQTAYPGRTVRVKLELLADTTSIAAVALFRDPKGKDWFVSFDLEPMKAKPPCPPAEPQISLWVDRMKIQDGRGRETQDSEESSP
jgi:type VI secretion system VasD/TssJ family lipoprotein